MDKEYILLNIIESEKDITQRELSQRTGVSLGSINLLINKMVKEGLIKIKRLPVRRIAYIVTPKGIHEKSIKTLHYIKQNYSFIQQIKEKIKIIIYNEQRLGKNICALIGDDEIGQLIKSIICEFDNITITESNKCSRDKTYIIANMELYEKLKSDDYHVINILNKL